MTLISHLARDVTKSSRFVCENLIRNANDVRTRQTIRRQGMHAGLRGYILNKKGSQVLSIDAVTEHGFILTNGWTIFGSTIFFPHTLLSWSVKNINEVNEKSLALFKTIYPKINLLIIGYGDKKDITTQKVRELVILCKQMGLNFELQDSGNAAATFNFCSFDRRYVAAALIPPARLPQRTLFNLHQTVVEL